ncbi:MAG TPA: response regulator [bacterium]|nr:response regulator [bacterium]
MDIAYKKRVLVVEDEEDVRIYLTILLGDMGFEVESAENGAQARKVLAHLKPDLITLDIVTPGKSGDNFFRELKADPALAGVPVIIVTGLQQDFRNFIEHRKTTPPPEGYVAKPFDPQTLSAAIEKALGA